jgi:hypothetical protein
MPKKRRQTIPNNAKCTVIGCTCEWIMMSKNRHYYCKKHMDEANALYLTYKTINAEALIAFDDDKLEQSILLREKYAREYLDYVDKGAHLRYINVLKDVLLTDKEFRKDTYNKLMSEQFADFEAII